MLERRHILAQIKYYVKVKRGEERFLSVNYSGMVAHTKPKKKEKRNKRKAKRGDKIKFIDLRFERCQVVRFRKARRRQDVP